MQHVNVSWMKEYCMNLILARFYNYVINACAGLTISVSCRPWQTWKPRDQISSNDLL